MGYEVCGYGWDDIVLVQPTHILKKLTFNFEPFSCLGNS